jgi:PAS domain S-box-containing protein
VTSTPARVIEAPDARPKPRTPSIRLSALPTGALLVDAAGRIVAANRRAAKTFRLPRRELRGRDIASLIPDWLATSPSAVRPERFERHIDRGDGRRIVLRGSRSLVVGDDEAQTLVLVADVTRSKANETAVRDSAYGFRQLAEALPQMLWTNKADGSLEFVGSRWVDYTGVGLEEQLRAGWFGQVHPDDREHVIAAFGEALRESRMFQAEFRVRRHDGEHRWCEAHAMPVRDRNGDIVRWFGLTTDVHEARQNRLALLEERDRFSMLVASAPGAIYSYRLAADGSMSFPFASAGIYDLFALTGDELAVSVDPAWRRVHPDDVQHMLDSIRQSAAMLTPWHDEWRILHPQRGEIWVEGRSVPTRESSGDTLWYGIIVDVTARKRSEAELRTSQARLRAAVMASGIGTWIWDAGKDRIWWDDTLLELFDRTRAEIERAGIKAAAEFVHPEDRAVVGQAMSAAFKGKLDTLSVEYRTVRRDGALQWIAVNGRVERDANGRVLQITGACMDITARKRAEEAQRTSQKIEALGTLAGGIAHDFNNILLAITGNARLAMAELPGEHTCARRGTRAPPRHPHT